jgi:hypothetical protein
MLTAAFVAVLILPPVLARFDRYFVVAQVPLSVLLVRVITRRLRFEPGRWEYVLPILMYLFSVVALQDYLAWNRARWAALGRLQAEYNAPLDQINGGYEFNGWYHSDRFVEESRATHKKVFGPHGWWIAGDEYSIMGAGRPGDANVPPGAVVRMPLGERKKYNVLSTQPYFTWLGMQRREILLLKRAEAEQ